MGRILRFPERLAETERDADESDREQIAVAVAWEAARRLRRLLAIAWTVVSVLAAMLTVESTLLLQR